MDKPPRVVPEYLLSLDSHIKASDLLIDGLQQTYLEAMISGKRKQWLAAAYAIVDLIGSLEIKSVENRIELKPTNLRGGEA